MEGSLTATIVFTSVLQATPEEGRRPVVAIDNHSLCSLHRRSNAHPSQVAAGTGSSCAAVAKDCSPIALSVVTSVSRLNKEIRRLTECISQHNVVVADFQKVFTLLAKMLKTEHDCDRVNKVKCSCQTTVRAKRQLHIEGTANDEDHTQERTPSQHDDPTYAPTLDLKFSLDHMPFRSKRSKRAQRNPRSGQDKTQRRKPPKLVDLSGERAREMDGLDIDVTSHHDALTPFRVVHESELLLMTAEKIPKAFKLAFVPTRSMDLAGVELAVVTYIFSKDLPKSEVLADVGHCVADRTVLLTLGPNERVMDDVITVVATMLSKTSSSHQWFMPTMIMVSQHHG
ncbi:hypothetical protein AHAS_Ahas02G0075900 [Arachis hypogaea]